MIEYFFALMGSYSLVSIIFLIVAPIKKKNIFKHPLYKKAINGQGVLHISHRGGSRENVENTIHAFQHAVKIGSNCIEMDVCFTKDKKVVVCHDSLLTRLCGVPKHVNEFNYNELPQFSSNLRLDFAVHDYIQTNQNHKFALLEDVFKMFPQTLMNIEIKTPHPELNQAVNDLIIKHKREQMTVWGARSPHHSDELYKLNPNIPRFFSALRVLQLYVHYIFGTLPFVSIQEDSLQIPLITKEVQEWKLGLVSSRKEALQIKVFYSFINFLNFISQPLFIHLRKRGCLVIYWVLNSEEDYVRAHKKGIHGIMTDHPTGLREFLIKQGVYMQ